MNTKDFELSQEEDEFLAPVMAALSDVAGFKITLSSLTERWVRFVKAVEAGYDDSIYEYTNDLGVRNLLENVISACPPPLRIRLTAVLDVWDGRFLNATERLSRPLTQRRDENPGWWWFRVPLRLGFELQKDLQEMFRDE
jgi:hypothetical protein